MGKKRKTGQCLYAAWKRIHLVDRCLLLFFGVLLLHSACSLFGVGAANAEAEHIDVIVRTSLASIFGYILSVNFGRGFGEGKDPGSPEAADPQDPVRMQSAEFRDGSETKEQGTAGLQILTAAAIGMVCLAVLLVYRNAEVPSAAAGSTTAAAAAAQLRDFVSGCVGFLIGSPGERKSAE